MNNWYRVDITVSDEAVEPICGGLFELSPSGFQIEPVSDNKQAEPVQQNMQNKQTIHGISGQSANVQNSGHQARVNEEKVAKARSGEARSGEVRVGEAQNANAMSVVTFYLPQDYSLEDAHAQIASLVEGLTELGFDMAGTKVDFTLISDEDWAENYKQFFTTVRIGHVLIKPSWEKEEILPGDVVVQLDPGLAFGTGSHPTTEGCVLLMQDVIRGGETVLDVGTGSGILAIAAVKLGASRVIAIDNDPIAIDVARENAVENGVDKGIELRVSETGSLGLIRAEVVVANITAPVIASIIPDIISNVTGLRAMIVAGIMSEQKDFVVDALVEHGFSITRTFEKNNWVSMIASYAASSEDVDG